MSDLAAVTPEGARRPIGSSALAREVRKLKPGQLGAIDVTEEAVFLWDAIVTCAAILIDDSDSRPWRDRLDDLFKRFSTENDLGPERIARAAEYINEFSNEKLPGWASALKRDGPRRFLIRMFGAATFRRCVTALQEDGSIISIALRRATRNLMPYAVALDDLYSVLSPEKKLTLPVFAAGQAVALSLALQLDELFETKSSEWGLTVTMAAAQDMEAYSLESRDLSGLAEQLRQIVTGRSTVAVTELNAALGRKIRGAREALEYSSDGVSQAANSLIELFDRILRTAFADDEVMTWVSENYPLAKGMTYVPQGSANAKPTKKAQALCFAHAGLPVTEPSPVHELAATAVVETRNALQKLKHADGGAREEAEELSKYLAAVEGFLTLAVGVIWATAPPAQVDRFRARLESRDQ